MRSPHQDECLQGERSEPNQLRRKINTQLNSKNNLILTNPKLLPIASEIYRLHHGIGISNAGNT